MFKTAAIVLLAIPLTLAGLVASSSCLIVDVKQSDGPRIVVPVPLFVARAALGFAPEEAKWVDVPELAEYSELAARVIEELRNAPDGVLIEVEDGNERVLIEKVGDEIAVEVEGDDEDVSVHLPLSVAAEVFDSHEGGRLEVGKMLDALASVSRSDLVHVRTRDEEVKVWIW